MITANQIPLTASISGRSSILHDSTDYPSDKASWGSDSIFFPSIWPSKINGTSHISWDRIPKKRKWRKYKNTLNHYWKLQEHHLSGVGWWWLADAEIAPLETCRPPRLWIFWRLRTRWRHLDQEMWNGSGYINVWQRTWGLLQYRQLKTATVSLFECREGWKVGPIWSTPSTLKKVKASATGWRFSKSDRKRSRVESNWRFGWFTHWESRVDFVTIVERL